jgi:protein involved in polysaccharide export with SLBB domain
MCRHRAAPRQLAVALLGLLAGAAAGSAAQQSDDRVAERLRAARPELEARLAQLRSNATPEQLVEAAAIRSRLAEGDFAVGDRIALVVEGQPDVPTPIQPPAPAVAIKSVEQQLTDTFTVGSDKDLALPVIGRVSLRGVLRAELETYLATQIGQFIREPMVHAQPLVRVSIVGEVARPGYYAVPTNAVLAATLMAAGGPTQEANLPKMRLERDGQPLWNGDELRQAIAHGRTLDEIGVHPGDAFVIPKRKTGDAYDAFKLVAVLLSLPVTVYTLTKVIH